MKNVHFKLVGDGDGNGEGRGGGGGRVVNKAIYQ